jgi:hypothetical protein
MNRSILLFSVIVFIFAVTIKNIHAQDFHHNEKIHSFSRRTVVLNIEARVIEHEQEVIWNETTSKTTIPGSPVSLRLEGSNVIVIVQFTPFIRRHGQSILVAQGQIWIETPNEGIRYFTSIQSIPLEFDEPIYFFPLGSSKKMDMASIQIMLTVNPYTEPGEPNEETFEISNTGEDEDN